MSQSERGVQEDGRETVTDRFLVTLTTEGDMTAITEEDLADILGEVGPQPDAGQWAFHVQRLPAASPDDGEFRRALEVIADGGKGINVTPVEYAQQVLAAAAAPVGDTPRGNPSDQWEGNVDPRDVLRFIGENVYTLSVTEIIGCCERGMWPVGVSGRDDEAVERAVSMAKTEAPKLRGLPQVADPRFMFNSGMRFAAARGGTPICGVICAAGPNGEPLACAYDRDHEGVHSWASLPTFERETFCLEPVSWDDGFAHGKRVTAGATGRLWRVSICRRCGSFGTPPPAEDCEHAFEYVNLAEELPPAGVSGRDDEKGNDEQRQQGEAGEQMADEGPQSTSQGGEAEVDQAGGYADNVSSQIERSAASDSLDEGQALLRIKAPEGYSREASWSAFYARLDGAILEHQRMAGNGEDDANDVLWRTYRAIDAALFDGSPAPAPVGVSGQDDEAATKAVAKYGDSWGIEALRDPQHARNVAEVALAAARGGTGCSCAGVPDEREQED